MNPDSDNEYLLFHPSSNRGGVLRFVVVQFIARSLSVLTAKRRDNAHCIWASTPQNRTITNYSKIQNGWNTTLPD